MPGNTSRLWSLKTRIAFFTLGIVLISFWSLAIYVSRMMHKDMEQQQGEQQFATVSLVAASINDEILNRLGALEQTAITLSPHILRNSSALQAFLEQRPLLLDMFNGGIIAYRVDGTAIAEIPLSAGRIGLNYMEIDTVAAALKDGKTTIGRPVIGKKLGAPVFGMTAPIRDEKGQVIGALAGVINLGLPNFLDKLAANRYGTSGGYLLVAPQQRRIIAASDKSRIMQALPPPGINSMLDRYLTGFEGFGIAVNSRGIEELSAARRIPAAGWLLCLEQPTQEAFAPIHAMLQRLLAATLLLSLLATAFTWWMLKRELAPLLTAAATLRALSDADHPVPKGHFAESDEIGGLIASFNRLLGTLAQREEDLKANEYRWKFAIEGAGDGLWDWNMTDDTAYLSPQWRRMLGYGNDELRIGAHEWEKRIHPADRTEAMARLHAYLDGRTRGYISEHRVRCKDGSYKWILDRGMVVERTAKGAETRMIGTQSDISARKHAEDALTRMRQLHRETERLGKVGGWEFDIASGRQTWTDETYRLHEVPPGFVPTVENGINFYAHSSRAIIEWAVDRAISHGEAFDLELEIVTAKGRLRAVHAIGRADLTHGRIFGFFQDISERRQAQALLLAAKAEVERANNAKSRFLAAASHDLRQPLAALALYVDVLKTEVSPDADDLLAHIEDCVGNLSDLLTDLLDISKLDAGAVTPKLSSVSIEDVMGSLVSVHLAEAESKNLSLRQRSCGVMVQTDLQLLKRIVGNLLANAVRYTEQGGILIACRRHQGKRWIEVWDTGMGIPEDQAASIFDEFTQLGDDARNRGSGLGLSIAAKAAALLGLRIRMHSQPGHGSMFAIELPPDSTAVPDQPQRPPDAMTGLRIALVEDNVHVLMALAKALEGLGHQVVAAECMSSLLQGLEGQKPDIVISDYRLAQGVRGFDVIAATRRAFDDDLPAIIITGDTDPDLIVRMAEQGITVHYKPFQIGTLNAIIDARVRQRAA